LIAAAIVVAITVMVAMATNAVVIMFMIVISLCAGIAYCHNHHWGSQ
jgi:hypothetical protein